MNWWRCKAYSVRFHHCEVSSFWYDNLILHSVQPQWLLKPNKGCNTMSCYCLLTLKFIYGYNS